MIPTDSSPRPTPGAEAGRTGGNERENALAPYLAQLCASAVPPSISVDGQPLTLEPWEQEVLRKYSTGVDPEGCPWPSLVQEGLAFGAKCLLREHQHEIEGSPSDRPIIPLDDLITEAAAGVAILEELGASVDQLIGGGRMTEVKHLSAFRNRVSQSVAKMRRLIGGEAYVEVEAKATEMVAERAMSAPAAPSTASKVAEKERRRVPTQYKKDQAPVRVVHRVTVKQSRLIWTLVAILVVSVGAWVGLTVAQPRYVAPPELTTDEFRHIPAVRAIDARPPSLFVTLDEPGWNDMSSEDRLNTIREIGSVAEQAGYVGVQICTADGTPSGRWMKKTGAQLIRNSPEGS
jgi:hypothetical protein